ncbi:hypothetical protein PVAND_011661 [Polypedilum vanderplanki]|uniref:non-specific serine/threonine protein kinase n=1 Tax=Polypedilum vanderplanki TaxID=319348 RepID=A0A9J6CK14_POLVA|nr:hypothetical protein PVAND_011661 [Polypedilum vanderplanki]
MALRIPALPVPEMLETNLNHSFKFTNQNDQKKKKRPPKLYPKEVNFLRNVNQEPHAVSFRDSSLCSNTSTPLSKSKNSLTDLSNSFYDKTKNESYFEQCFETCCKIGEGSFGEVFKVLCKEDGKYYAIKKLRFFHRGVNYRKEKMQEVRRYEEFSGNDYCLSLYKAWEQFDCLFMQMELCCGSVEDYVEKVKKVSESFVWSFLFDMLMALKCLHDRNLIHLDLKLDNVLMTNNNRCKLADFGLVFDLKNSDRSRAVEGDSRYLAPELLNNNYCLANDIFSLGIALLELATNLELPSSGNLWQELRSGIIPFNVKNKLSPELLKIISQMMDPDPIQRPTVDQLLKNKKLVRMRKMRELQKSLRALIMPLINACDFIKSYIIFAILFVFNFFQLKDKTKKSYKYNIPANNIGNISDDDESNTKSLSIHNSSRLSQISIADDDDDSNNESNVTPTLNNSIPRITPEIKIINSTPLNHYNHQNQVSSRKFRRDLTKSCFENDDGICSPVVSRNSSLRNSSQNNHSIISKKLLFHDEDDE